MNRIGLFHEAKAACLELQRRFPGDTAIASVVKQLDFLIELEEGKRMDAERLSDIIIPVLTTREIEQLDDGVANLLYQVCDQFERMKGEWVRRGYDVGGR
jgi:hypothetical protein